MTSHLLPAPLRRAARAVVPVLALLGGLAVAPAPVAGTPAPTVPIGAPVAFGDAPTLGSMAGQTLAAPVVGMAPAPSGGGYWLVAADGGVFSYGTARSAGSAGGLHLAAPVVGMAATPDGGGYWLVAADGGVFAYGDATFSGSAGGLHLAAPVVAMAATPDGGGYWLVAADGGVFAYGDATFSGSAGGLHLAAPVVGMAATPDGGGYWLVAADGGVFAYGDATFYGSAAGAGLGAAVVSMAATPGGGGYWLASANGGVFTFGDARFLGSLGGAPLTGERIGALAATPDGGGYWLLPVPPPPPPPPNPAWAGAVVYSLQDLPVHPYPPGDKVVALTFDDGPSPVYTPQILAVLVAEGVPATFQIIGEEGVQYPYLLQAEVADGMSLVNHTWTHPDLEDLSPAQLAQQIDSTNQLLEQYTGVPTTCLRPPYGDTNATVVAALAQRDMAELMWNVDPSDYLQPGASVIAARVIGAVVPGSIVVMHDGGGNRSQTVAALPTIISTLRAEGYTFVLACP